MLHTAQSVIGDPHTIRVASNGPSMLGSVELPSDEIDIDAVVLAEQSQVSRDILYDSDAVLVVGLEPESVAQWEPQQPRLDAELADDDVLVEE